MEPSTESALRIFTFSNKLTPAEKVSAYNVPQRPSLHALMHAACLPNPIVSLPAIGSQCLTFSPMQVIGQILVLKDDSPEALHLEEMAFHLPSQTDMQESGIAFSSKPMEGSTNAASMGSAPLRGIVFQRENGIVVKVRSSEFC